MYVSWFPLLFSVRFLFIINLLYDEANIKGAKQTQIAFFSGHKLLVVIKEQNKKKNCECLHMYYVLQKNKEKEHCIKNFRS